MFAAPVLPVRTVAQQGVAKVDQAVCIHERRSALVVLVPVCNRKRKLILVEHRRPDDLRPDPREHRELAPQLRLPGLAELLELRYSSLMEASRNAAAASTAAVT